MWKVIQSESWVKRLVRLPTGIAAVGQLSRPGRDAHRGGGADRRARCGGRSRCRESSRVEERAGVGELGPLVAILEAAGSLADVEGHVDLFARRERLIERVDGVEIARARGDAVEGPIEAERS